MRINSISRIAFEKLPMRKENDVKILENFTYRTKDENGTLLNVDIHRDNWLNQGYFTQFKVDKSNNWAAHQHFTIQPEADNLCIYSMETHSSFQKNLGVGKTLHLLNIIEMLENNLGHIYLVSASSTIPFHTKMGFEPDGHWGGKYDTIKSNLQRIANETDPKLSKKYAKKAKELIKSKETSRKKSFYGNKLILAYTKDALKRKSKEELMSLFDDCMPMKLTREYVLKNKEFYNNLFNEYAIDYQIN